MARDDDPEGAGEELDLEALEREAAKVERRALDIDFGDVVPDTATGIAGRRHGAASLETDGFLSRREQEALARAQGETPALDRLGKKAAKATRSKQNAPVLPMDRSLRLSSRGLPGWAWVAICLALAAALVTAGTIWLGGRQQIEPAEAATLEAARERVRAEEEARLRRLEQGD